MRSAGLRLWLEAVALLMLFVTGECCAQSLRDYYPLQVGNEWEYISEQYSAPLWRDTCYVSVRVVAAETYEAKEHFKSIINAPVRHCTRFSGEGQEFSRYERYDMLAGEYAEMAAEYASYCGNELKSEETIIEHRPETGEERPSLYWFSVFDDSIVEYPISVPAGIFEDIAYCRDKRVSAIFHIEKAFFLARDVGMVYSSTFHIFDPGFECTEIWKLTYAKVNGVEYGTKQTPVQNSTWWQIKALFR